LRQPKGEKSSKHRYQGKLGEGRQRCALNAGLQRDDNRRRRLILLMLNVAIFMPD
jgi:hypothetical protein